MPVLKNPRHEAFARAIFAGLFNPNGKPTNGQAYIAAGYHASLQRYGPPGHQSSPAEVNASKLLKSTKVLDRVNELIADAQRKQQKTIDISRDRFARRLHRASEIAEEDRNAAAMGANEMHLAKLFGLITDKVEANGTTIAQAKTMHELGRGWLAALGHVSPSDRAIEAATAAHGRFVAELELICETDQGLVLEGEAS